MAHHAPPPPPSPPPVFIGGGADQSQYPAAPPPCLHSTSQGICTDNQSMGGGVLPFTGADIVLYVMIGILIIIAGFAMRRRA